MISKEELKEYARITMLNLGQAEKDYFQTIILFILYQVHGKDLIFKGGTALKKCFGLNRFSEDLDFTCNAEFNLRELENGLKRFRLDYGIETKTFPNGLKIILKIKGPLFNGNERSVCKFIIDNSFREQVVLKPEIRMIGRFLEEIPAFDVFVMQEKEILAEKIRAVLSRNKARDVYDLWFLLSKGIEVDKKLVSDKFNYYKQKFNYKEFEKSIQLKKSIWITELKPLILNAPSFNEIKKIILSKAKKWNL